MKWKFPTLFPCVYVSIAAFTDNRKIWRKWYFLLSSLGHSSSSDMCSNSGFTLGWLSSPNIISCVGNVLGSSWSEILSEIWRTGWDKEWFLLTFHFSYLHSLKRHSKQLNITLPWPPVRIGHPVRPRKHLKYYLHDIEVLAMTYSAKIVFDAWIVPDNLRTETCMALEWCWKAPWWPSTCMYHMVSEEGILITGCEIRQDRKIADFHWWESRSDVLSLILCLG